MPILIRELVIKAKIETDTARAPAQPGDSGDSGSCAGLTAEDLARILADQRER